MTRITLPTLVNQTVGVSICHNRQTNQSECCQDYRNVSGHCEACIGSWGKSCQRNCSFGFYGHGCRNTCDCNLQQICDRRQGCVRETSIYNATATTPMNVSDIDFNVLEILCLFLLVIIFFLLWRGFLYFHRKMNYSENTNRTSEEINTDIPVAEWSDDEESVYSDERESIFIASGSNRESSYTFLRSDISGSAISVAEKHDDEESVYSDIRESKLIASRSSTYTLLMRKMSSPAISNFKSFPTKIPGGREYTLTEKDYNRVQLKVHHTLQENTVNYDFCSHEMYNQYPDDMNPLSPNRKQEARKDPECVDAIENDCI